MKKIILTALLTVGSLVSFSQEKEVLLGLFEGFDGSVYGFSDEFEEYTMFDEVDPKILELFDLKSDEYLYSDFKIMYIKTENEDGDTILKIVDLVLLDSNNED